MLEVTSKVELVKQISKHARVLALFSSSWCPYCQKFTKIFNAHVTSINVNLVIHVNMNDYASPLWNEYAVVAVPTLIFFENNTIKSRLDAVSGEGLTENCFTNWIKTI
jgi:thioredoxin-related protein